MNSADDLDPYKHLNSSHDDDPFGKDKDVARSSRAEDVERQLQANPNTRLELPSLALRAANIIEPAGAHAIPSTLEPMIVKERGRHVAPRSLNPFKVGRKH